MGFGICGHRFRRSPFTNKIFYIYKSRLECLSLAPLPAGSGVLPEPPSEPPSGSASRAPPLELGQGKLFLYRVFARTRWSPPRLLASLFRTRLCSLAESSLLFLRLFSRLNSV